MSLCHTLPPPSVPSLYGREGQAVRQAECEARQGEGTPVPRCVCGRKVNSPSPSLLSLTLMCWIWLEKVGPLGVCS